MPRFHEILSAGGPVLLLLAGLSIYTLAVAWERWSCFGKATRGLRPFLDRLRQHLSKGEMSEALAQCRQHRGLASEVLLAALAGPSHKEERLRSIERALERQVSTLQRGLAPLGTIASTAPFIGLFGTVLGVMRAFRDLASASSAGPGVVAVGISEALVTTAAGLFVAIPATVAYNYFSGRSQRFAEELRWISEEILEQLSEKSHR